MLAVFLDRIVVVLHGNWMYGVEAFDALNLLDDSGLLAERYVGVLEFHG